MAVATLKEDDLDGNRKTLRLARPPPSRARGRRLGAIMCPGYAFALLAGTVAVAGLQWIEGGGAGQGRSRAPRRRAPRWLVIVVAVVALLTSTAATVQMVRVGHSGAAATWSGVGAGGRAGGP